MITETTTKKQRPAITSDRWHVVRAAFTDSGDPLPEFARKIVSEHDEKVGAEAAAKALRKQLAKEMSGRKDTEQDQVFVRAPGFRSVKLTSHLAKAD